MDDSPAASDLPNVAPVAVYPTRALARERSAVLLAKGFTHWTNETQNGFELFVEGRHVAEARTQLDAYDREQAEVAQHPPSAPLQQHAAGWGGLIIAAVLLSAIFRWQHKNGSTLSLEWSRDSVQIFGHGQWWRAATALVLHDDFAHLAGNIFFGAVFGIFVARAFGPWLGWSLVLVSGILGNLVTAAVWYPDPYRGIGASTAVFGAVGILVGAGVIEAAQHHGLRHHRAWMLPLGGGLALLGLFGSGGEKAGVDLAAHLFGFLCGLPLGALAGAWQQKQWRRSFHPGGADSMTR
ncbi:MAG: rhomboid family intramembrane serine protease [Verrucomicrobiales bacterium]